MQAPVFTLPDQSGAPWSSAEALERGALVVVLYRGDW
jgi:peroxiredoxin